LQNSGKVPQDCNQEGIVVVRITVDNNGQVIDAQPGVKGTTNSHPCLLAPAKETALLHRWNPDAQAPKRQIGFIVIQFKLSE
jgi:colicin import membrane protein